MIYWQNLLHFKVLWRAVIKPRPLILYKYHSINKFLFDIINQNALWAGSASNLNDPYDCSFELTQDFIKTMYIDPINQSDFDADIATPELFEKAKGLLLLAFDDELRKKYQEMYRSSLGVCCFSTNSISELMWSHYAESAKGVCLIFSFKNNPAIHKKLVPIKYTNKAIPVKTEIDRFKMLFQKRNAWSYEQEWRILTEAGHLSFKKENLIGIIFGPRAPEESVKKVKQALFKNEYKANLSTCVYRTSGLKIVPLDDFT